MTGRTSPITRSKTATRTSPCSPFTRTIKASCGSGHTPPGLQIQRQDVREVQAVTAGKYTEPGMHLTAGARPPAFPQILAAAHRCRSYTLILQSKQPPDDDVPDRKQIVCHERLDGLLKHFARRAA